jgi:hypothetical protein
MPTRIPLNDIPPSTPEHIERMLLQFGTNPYHEPRYRFIWSERKSIWFAGEVVPEYSYLEKPCWVLETWVEPEKDAGPRAAWGVMQEALMGPYPAYGTYNFVQQFDVPDEESVRLYCVGVEKTKALTDADRKTAIKDAAEAKEKAGVEKVAEEIVELQDSASMGKIQQAVSGPKNNFRTAEDYQRDTEKASRVVTNLPKHGGKIY